MGFRRRGLKLILALASLAISLSACSPMESEVKVQPGAAQFSNSCSGDVQADFEQAITLLHSFEYPETTKLFAAISAQDPGCAMARWGSAMSLWHPLWAPPGPSSLNEGARLLASTAELETTSRERAYITALQAFFASSDPRTHRDRVLAYEKKMSLLYQDYLEDPEAAVFYSLALLASADPTDKSYAAQFKSAGLLNWIRASHPDHPGVLHYLIHSYDYPGLAHLALDAALTYAEAAPDSAHAQHMPSHIFTRLGLWDLSLSSNHDSTRSAAEYTARAGLPGHYDEGLHSMDYLMYAMLQTARDAQAKQLVTRLAEIGRTDTENFKVAYTYAAAPARYAMERRRWEEASQLQLVREDFPWQEFGWALSIHHFARGIGAARSDQAEAARRELATIRELQANLPDTTLPYWREEVQVHADAVQSWIDLSEGFTVRALARAAVAADREDSVDKHPVTPGEVLPARELYADMLLETGNSEDALKQFQTVLQSSPNRLNALLGAASAAEQSGLSDLAEKYRDKAQDQTAGGIDQRTTVAGH